MEVELAFNCPRAVVLAAVLLHEAKSKVALA